MIYMENPHEEGYFFSLNYPACKITDFGYTASYIRQASPELGGAPIIMSDGGFSGTVKVTHLDLSYILCSIYDNADMISHI